MTVRPIFMVSVYVMNNTGRTSNNAYHSAVAHARRGCIAAGSSDHTDVIEWAYFYDRVDAERCDRELDQIAHKIRNGGLS